MTMRQPTVKPRQDTGKSPTPLRAVTPASSPAGLGAFLRDRRARLVPPLDGPSPPSRRRTPGLRREEVAARAGVSITWYTWLEQGRGGPPSEEVIERLARALELGRTDREMLYLLAQQRPPPVDRVAIAEVPSSVRAVLDALAAPAFVKTSTWDIVAWNEPMTALNDFGKLPLRDRNVLRRTFLDPASKKRGVDWEKSARSAVAVFRMDVARMGGSPEASALQSELAAASEDFRRMWADHEVRVHGSGKKELLLPSVGALGLVSSAYSVEGADGLSLVVFTPATPEDEPVLARLLARKRRLSREPATRPRRP